MTPEFNAWWTEGETTTDNPYEAGSFAFWAWEGWQAGVRAEREACFQIALAAGDWDAGCSHTDAVAKRIKERGQS